MLYLRIVAAFILLVLATGPAGVSTLGAGDLLVASFSNQRVLRYDGDSGVFVEIFAIGGLSGPHSGDVYDSH